MADNRTRQSGWRDNFGIKVAFVGPPASGKTATAMLLTSKLKAMHINAEMVPEYARTYIVQNGGINNLFEQFVILRQQCAAEEELLSRHDVVVCDSASFLCYVYARRLAGNLDERKANALSLMYRDVMKHVWTYAAIYFVQPKEIGILDDGVRTQVMGDLPAIAAAIRGFLDLEGVPYKVLGGSPEERIAVVLGDLEEGEQWGVFASLDVRSVAEKEWAG